MMSYRDIPKVLFSHVQQDDPFRASKLFQIERWSYANWSLLEVGGKQGHDFLARVLSREDCWNRVSNIHGVKLNRQTVGKELIASGSPFDDMSYKIACRYCLEEDIVSLFEDRKRRLSTYDDSSLLEYDHLVACVGSDMLTTFWSHFISGYIHKLEHKIKGRHPYEYALDCAVSLKQAQAVEFFWNKIRSLSEEELSNERKDSIFMNTTIRTAGSNYNYSCPEIFEFCFSQVSPSRYKELLRRDLAENSYYGSLSALLEARCFDQYASYLIV
ncbi:hypothetical protein [Wolbachia endosymbiont of Tetranychus urticae]|uniref:hypothetical protein n=1 Tax=Wolbachia endosymbiont of Tetranychus urticae TaxID=169184 RepID=UPI00397D7BB8